MKQLNISIKQNLIVGILIGVWLFIFAFIIKPFDDGTINFRSWLLISIGFSSIAFVCYAVLSFIQKTVYEKISKWNLGLETASILFFFLIYLFGIYSFYKSPILNGGYSFAEFFSMVFIKVTLVLTPVIILTRRYLLKLIPIKDDLLIFRGENKHDVLKIKQVDLICISNAQNYVEIFYAENNILKSKIIRSSLKKVQQDFDFLVQIHRSHLINPFHFKSWKDSNTILLTQMELPVSKNYKENILVL
ncbi:LytTR family transcriptional regulator DNA-binding domain-containing protein [Flavobacterium hungaricum]|uniref:LytTR family transcriptional regulator n=1 Tax=Flavobacterium hungaricum TaxID=2082725 RepID=A0ABR9TQH9_9FLAO|nr:LytTR family transcriptional regulator [Flavobacterium hungaricum]